MLQPPPRTARVRTAAVKALRLDPAMAKPSPQQKRSCSHPPHPALAETLCFPPTQPRSFSRAPARSPSASVLLQNNSTK